MDLGKETYPVRVSTAGTLTWPHVAIRRAFLFLRDSEKFKGVPIRIKSIDLECIRDKGYVPTQFITQ